MQLSNVDFADIQGLVRFGHGHLKEASFLLLKVANADAARAWLAVAPVTNAVDHKATDTSRLTAPAKAGLPDRALQVAFSYQGLRALGASPQVLNGFASEFTAGMVGASRSRRLGDVGRNDPHGWEWGGAGNVPDVLVLLYAAAGQLQNWQREVESHAWNAAFVRLHCLTTNDIGDIEPFGFADGISQPVLDWERQKPIRLEETHAYTNISALGEFLLGYPNEYGRYTDRPLLDPTEDRDSILPLAEDVPGKRDFGRNGTYLVVRDLLQDVKGFWRFIDDAAQQRSLQRQRLAEAMVGRMRSGDPIVPLSNQTIPGVGPGLEDVWRNQFTFHNDPNGTACPFGAHIRRANPRTADLPEGTTGVLSRAIRRLGFSATSPRDDLIASSRFHRILRRGREYGPELTPEDALAPGGSDDEQQRGLRFICLNANISRQFEFLQSSWIANPKFNGLEETDPLLGNREPLWAGGSTDTFSRPRERGLPCRTADLQQFVTVRGGGYFFLPGISAVRYLARGSERGH